MTSQVDVQSLITEAEEVIRGEYRDVLRKVQDQNQVLRRQHSTWSNITKAVKEALIEAGEATEEDLPDEDAVLDRLTTLLDETFKFKKLFKFIQDNTMLSSQWDKMMMSIKLVGGDSND